MFNFGPDMILRIPALLIALTFHEYAHAYASYRLGDPTPKFQGRLTLNPLAHLDPMGLLMLWLFRFGWAKPVEVNPRNYQNREKGMALVAFAGPAMNILLGFVAMTLFYLNALYLRHEALGLLLNMLIIYNVYFAVFNLLPIPPLDGSKLLFAFLPRRVVYQYLDKVSQYGFLILILLVASGAIGTFLVPVANVILRIYGSILGIFF